MTAYNTDIRDFNPTKKYSVIYADPPWYYETYSEKGWAKSPNAQYKCMSNEDIKNIPVNNWTTDDAILFIWGIDSMLPVTLDVIQSWGFTYKTVGFYWTKTTVNNKWAFGLGYWTIGNPEMCLLATKGSPKRVKYGVEKLVVDRIGRHSSKPEEVAHRIERLVKGPYLELFGRRERDNWDVVGNDIQPKTNRGLF